MGLFRYLANRFEPEREQRASPDPSWSALASFSPQGHAADARQAENLTTVLACVNVISTATASLPAWVYRSSEKGRQLDSAHPVAGLIANGPNEHQTWPDFIEWLLSSTLLRGNGLAEIVTDQNGTVTELRPIPWDWVSVSLLPTGRLAYDVSGLNHLHGGTGRTRRLLESEVFHLKDRSDDGMIGRSRLSRVSQAVQNGLAMQGLSNDFYDNGLYPSGVLEIPQSLNQEGHKTLRESIEKQFTGPQKNARILILSEGSKWQQVSITPEDAELLASRRFSTEEMARVFQVPPPLVGIWDNSTFTNSETAGRWFAQHTLSPWIRKIEAEFKRSVFSEASRSTHELEIDLSGFMRGDYQARWAAHKIAVEAGILSPNEVREVEGWNPRPAGDSFAGTPGGANGQT